MTSRRRRFRRRLSYLFLAGGLFFLVIGTRELWDARFGQFQAARSLDEEPVPDVAAQPSQPAPAAPAPRLGDAVAKLLIPRLDAELYVVEGTGHKELRRGPGHMSGSAMPGEDGNCIIAGHRDTHFRVLKDIRKGDDILLETPRGEFVYRVRQTSVISPKNLAPLRDTPDARLNLITCYPFYWLGAAPKRFVVQAELTAILPAAGRPPS